MIENLDQLKEAISRVVQYNWDDEERDYRDCLEGSGNDPEGHIFLTLQDLSLWLGDQYPRYPTPQQLIQAARQVEPNNERLVESGGREETATSIVEAHRVLGGERPEAPPSPDPDEQRAAEFFVDEEPGSVSEEAYQRVLDGIRSARGYLEEGCCWRVGINRAVGQTRRVNWYETTADDTEEGVRAHWEGYLKDLQRTSPGALYLVSARKATVEEDLDEMIDEIAEEENW